MNVKALLTIMMMALVVTAKTKKKKQHSTSSSSSSEEHSSDSDIDKISEDSVESDAGATKYKSLSTIKMKGIMRKFLATVTLQAVPDKRNLIFSPISAMLPLGELALAADGETLKELLWSAGTKSKTAIKIEYRQLIRGLQQIPGVTLCLASRVYIDYKSQLKQQFENDVKDAFSSSVYKIDFDNPSESVQTINGWVSNVTRGKITQLVTKGDLPRFEGGVVIVNGIYFCGHWKYPFKKVRIGEFYTSSGVQKVKFMSSRSEYNYYKSKTLQAKIVAIPYEGDAATMVMVLPNKSSGVTALLEMLKKSPTLINLTLKKLKPTPMQVTIPKFKITTNLDLAVLYKKLGLHSMFQRERGFEKMVQGYRAYVTRAVQKAYIEVMEMGSQITVLSGASIDAVPIDPPNEFTANRPFIFYVIYKKEQLFAGMVNRVEV